MDTTKLSAKLLGTVASIAIVGFIGINAIFTVEPTQFAGTRFLGTPNSETFGPGLHVKIPFADVDHLESALNTFKINNNKVYTLDNQQVKISMSILYRIPKDAVHHLLYEVGRSGNVDIDANIETVASNRVSRIIATYNTIVISEKREEIENKMRASVQEELQRLFGLDVESFQITALEYSKIFEDSVEKAVQAKNDAVAAENLVKKFKAQADQAEATARGEANSKAINADGDKRAAIARAEGDAAKIRLAGEAEAYSMGVRGTALDSHKSLIDYTIAEKYKGDVPTILGSGTTPFVNIPGLGK